MSEGQKSSVTSFMTPVAIIIAGVIIAGAVLFKDGSVNFGSKDSNVKAVEVGNDAQVAPNAIPIEEAQTINLDDDAVLGDPNAPITIIEFSDYECPYCKRHVEQTYPQIKENYIDTGKVKLIFRDLPLSFHDPAASKEAEVAECVRDQVGDSKYFEFHDLLFVSTQGNGSGMPDEKLYSLVTQVGADSTQVKSCLENGDKKQEVINDKTEGASYGVTGTPSFFVGKSEQGNTIQGEKIVGAQPHSTFEAVFEKLLN